MESSTPQLTFKHVESSQRELIHSWLDQEYIKEWISDDGLENILESLDESFDEPSGFTHWIVYDQETPFAYLLTSVIHPDDDDQFTRYHISEGEMITLDIFICEESYLGKGLCAPLIRDFLQSEFPQVKAVFIDPEVRNTRATHVYEKVGFKIVGEHIAPWHPVPHHVMRLEL